MSIEKLQEILGIETEPRKVMRVVSVDNGKATLQAGNTVLVVTGTWAIGTQLVVRGGNVESVVSSAVGTLFID